MSLDVHFNADIEKILNALEGSNRDALSISETVESKVYRKGYMDALKHVAKAMGIPINDNLIISTVKL